MLGRIARGAARHGALGSVRASWYLLVEVPRERRRRRRAKPTFKELVQGTDAIEVTAEDLLTRLGLEVSPELSALADARMLELEQRTASAELQFPERFAVEHESGRFLYLLVRSACPELMVETGVANGASTFLVLSAMEENGSGTLVSVDVTVEVGALLSEEEHASERWDLRVIDAGDLADVLEDVGPIDAFLHDSDHSYANMSAELSAAWPAVRPGGIVAADDGESSYAFLEASERHGAQAFGLFDRRKILMAARR